MPDEPDIAAAPEPSGRGRRWRGLTSSLFGDDVFLSYSRRDGALYALALASELTRHELSCFVDLWGTPPGTTLPASLKRRLHRSGMLVLVGSPGAAQSPHVGEEVVAFLATGRPLVPISFTGEEAAGEQPNAPAPGSLAAAAWYPRISGVALALDSVAALQAGTPAPATVNRIVNAKGFMRRSQRLRRVFWSTATATVAILVVGAVVAASLLGKSRRALAQVERGVRAARAERLVIQAGNSLEQGPQLATLLALEALHVTDAAGEPPAPAAVQALRDAVTRLGTASRQVALPPEARWLDYVAERNWLIAHERERIGVWVVGERATQRHSLALPASPDGVVRGCSDVSIGPSGRWMTANCLGLTRHAWDLAGAGEVLRPIAPDELVAQPEQLADPDMRWLLAQGIATEPKLDIDSWRYDHSENWRWLVHGVDGEKLGLSELRAGEVVGPLKRFADEETFVAFSPASRWLVTRRGEEVRVWEPGGDLRTSRVLRPIREKSLDLHWSPDERWLVIEDDVTFTVWNIADPPFRSASVEVSRMMPEVVFSPDGKWCALIDAFGDTRFFRLSGDDAPAVEDLISTTADVRKVRFSPDSRWLCVETTVGTTLLRDLSRDYRGQYVTALDKEEILRRLRGATCLQFSPDSRWLVTAADRASLDVWDLRLRGQAWREVRLSQEGISHVAFTAKSDQLLAAVEGRVLIWELPILSRSVQPAIAAHDGYIYGRHRFSADAGWLLTTRDGDRPRLWRVPAVPGPLRRVALPEAGISSGPSESFFSGGSRWVGTVDRDRRLSVWALPTAAGTPPRRLASYEAVDAIGQDPAQTMVAVGGPGPRAVVLSLPAGAPAAKTRRLDGVAAAITGFEVSGDSRWLLAMAAEPPRGVQVHTAQVWDLGSPGNASRPVLVVPHALSSRMSSNGAWLGVVTDEDDDSIRARVWRLSKGAANGRPVLDHRFRDVHPRPVFTPDERWFFLDGDRPWFWRLDATAVTAAHMARVGRAAAEEAVVSPNGRWLAVLLDAGGIELWDLMAERLEAPATVLRASHSRELSFSADGTRLLAETERAYGGVVWDLDHGSWAGRLVPANTSVPKWAFSPDGRWLAEREEGTVWNLETHASYPLGDILATEQPFSADGRWLVVSNYAEARLCDLSTPPTLEGLACQFLGSGPIDGILPGSRYAFGESRGGDLVALWVLELADLIDLATRSLPRDLTAEEWERFLPGEPYHETRRLSWRHANKHAAEGKRVPPPDPEISGAQ